MTEMAISSIFEKVKITDPKVAEAFVKALEDSKSSISSHPSLKSNSKMATAEDRKRLRELRKNKNNKNSEG